MTKRVEGPSCDYCGKVVNMNAQYKFAIKQGMYGLLEAYHEVCKSSYEFEFENHVRHRAFCHLKGCKKHPLPRRGSST